MRELIACVAVVPTVGLASAASAVLKEEPPMGKLKKGQRVLVDNGSCPKGQVLEVPTGPSKCRGKDTIERSGAA